MLKMATRGLCINLCVGVTARFKAGIKFAAEYSVYHQCINTIELTTAQTVILSMFHCLLNGDIATLHTLLSVIPYLPQLRSSFIGVWLRDDYRFRQEDVAKVLSTLAKLVKQGDVMVPLPVIIAFSGLEEKYDVFSFFKKSGDTTAQEMLACLNPLVTRATQVGPEGFKNQAVEARVCTETSSTQTKSQLTKEEQTAFEDDRRKKREPEMLPIPSSSKTEKVVFEDCRSKKKDAYTMPIPSSSKKEQTAIEDDRRKKREPEMLPIPSSSKTEKVVFEDCRSKKKDANTMPIPSSSKKEQTALEDDRRKKREPEMLPIPSSTAQLLLQQANGLVPVHFIPIVHPMIAVGGNTAQSLIEEYLDSERMEDSINIPDIEGNLPIHRAALDGRTDVVEALLQQGARLNDKNSFNMTPLQMAISSCRTDTIIFLLSLGASLQTRDIMGMTPLHHAACYGDPEVIKLLLSYRLNKEAKDSTGNRPLHIASKLGHTEAVRLLINAGANRKVRDCEGFRPIDWALQHGDSEMFRILRERRHRFR